MDRKIKSPSTPDMGDYLKVFACAAVMLQIILGQALQTHPTVNIQIGIGICYNFIKFTAPAFITGILYTTMRVTHDTNLSYRGYLQQMWHASFIPTIAWTLVYLLIMPNVQQVEHYHTIGDFAWQFINGNAAPHLWYNSMMLQFIILMPLFWWLANWCGHNQQRGRLVLLLTSVVQLVWLIFYDTQVFHGPHAKDWYLLDRLFVSFLLYAVVGTLAWQYRQVAHRWLQKHGLITVFALGSFVWINYELFAFKFPVQLTNAPYYKPSMTIYDLSIISLIAALGDSQLTRKLPVTHLIHRLANFAYPAFLSNVFWNQLLWRTFGQGLMSRQPVLGIFSVYIGTWLLSFASAITIHQSWSWLNRHFRRRLM
ncbi:acyltransferase family protein [Lentilactobacillus buchneri]|uniref:Acyltransferase n=1 Tax=Lentilactobacillus buchneri subsp. silagei CD034 TaxID=1071400 RepID=J9W5U5_LENBU|nr:MULTISPECIES: membrane protein [Lentilactobacillus]MCC6101336.1 acyltransferase [Lactobacillus sp.]AFR99630.1 hypothetical protein LBUCD034_0533 [Lentilactobacillus buchneri subsp. silagei CD034]MCT2901541.1 acyltransferase [Lentilactobacillus buchneri]MCT3543211.1 acyltransferase [Lentilactobacillus buchneri]MCT3544162.1 acyltransferase [Lentilactobacillus buchneri]